MHVFGHIYNWNCQRLNSFLFEASMVCANQETAEQAGLYISLLVLLVSYSEAQYSSDSWKKLWIIFIFHLVFSCLLVFHHSLKQSGPGYILLNRSIQYSLHTYHCSLMLCLVISCDWFSSRLDNLQFKLWKWEQSCEVITISKRFISRLYKSNVHVHVICIYRDAKALMWFIN